MDRKIYVISDLHFDDKKIIKYCSRPFKNLDDMHYNLVSNWNHTVGKDDLVYILGDIAFGGLSNIGYWLSHLNGEKTIVFGDHDGKKQSKKWHINLSYEGYDILMIHDPKKYDKNDYDLMIHGHLHSNDLERYPFINGEEKRVNVSADVVDFRPASLDDIINYIGAVPDAFVKDINSYPEKKKEKIIY